jgi:hypothetical protein
MKKQFLILTVLFLNVLFLNKGFSQDLGIVGIIEKIKIADIDRIEVEFKIFTVDYGKFYFDKLDINDSIFRFQCTSKQLMIDPENESTYLNRIFLLYFNLEKDEYILEKSIIANISNGGYCKKCKRELKGIAYGKDYITIVYYCPKHEFQNKKIIMTDPK